jgi:flagellar biosynthesis/type III secretory pathway chaperone
MGSNEENVAVLKRLREMLSRQREKLGSYLVLLEKEKDAIQRGDSTLLLTQVEMEKSIIQDLAVLKKVIAPLSTLYQAAYPASEETIPRLKATLDTMHNDVIVRNARNRQLLREKMDQLRGEISSLRAWPKDASPYAEVAPGLVDITT